MLDLTIRNGRIIDGTGRPEFDGDVGIRDGRIVEVGRVGESARRVIDAAGHLVTPGFVDLHTHYDGQVSWDNLLAPSSLHGVTSIAMGNCGVGFAPARPDQHDWLINLLEGVEDIPGTALAEGLAWDWESFPDYLDAIARREYTLDIGAQVPHSALRAYVMGERGGDHTEAPSAAEITRMQQLTLEALQAGALGFTSSRTDVHRTRAGKNIGTLSASEQELLGITEAVRAHGNAVIQLISDAYRTPDDAFAGRELDLIERLARSTGAPLSFTVQQSDEAPERFRFIFERVAAMVGEGLNVRVQVAPRPVGVILTFASTTNPFLLTPTYRALTHRHDLGERLAELARPEVRARILAEHDPSRRPGIVESITHGFHQMFRMEGAVDYEPPADASIAAEAQRLGRNVAEHLYDVLLEADGRRLLYLPVANYSHGSLDDVYEMMTAPFALYGLSDGGAHCGTICDASFPTTTLSLWSRGNRSGKRIPLERLVHGYTQRNALQVGWHDRGVIAPGYLADLNVIDFPALGLGAPELVRDLPAGGTRLLQHARGYRQTIKTGVVTFEDGTSTGALPGRLVRGARSR